MTGAWESDKRGPLGVACRGRGWQAIKVMGLLEGLPLSLLGHSSGGAVACEASHLLTTHWGYTPPRVICVGLRPPDVSPHSLMQPPGVNVPSGAGA